MSLDNFTDKSVLDILNLLHVQVSGVMYICMCSIVFSVSLNAWGVGTCSFSCPVEGAPTLQITSTVERKQVSDLISHPVTWAAQLSLLGVLWK